MMLINIKAMIYGCLGFTIHYHVLICQYAKESITGCQILDRETF